MGVSIGRCGIVLKSCQSDVAFVVDPHGQGVPAGDQNPLPNIKLFLINNERIFNIFLDNLAASSGPSNVLDDFIIVIEHFNPSSSASASRLCDP